MNNVDVNALGQAMDTSWGRSSTSQSASFSVKLTMQGADRILASYAAIVNFGTEHEMIRMKRAYADESASVIKEVIKVMKERYKDLCGKTISVKEIGTSDSLDIKNFNSMNMRRSAYFRRKTIFEIT